jgi:hypothetical protein
MEALGCCGSSCRIPLSLGAQRSVDRKLIGCFIQLLVELLRRFRGERELVMQRCLNNMQMEYLSPRPYRCSERMATTHTHQVMVLHGTPMYFK